MRQTLAIVTLALTLVMGSCPKPEQDARDTAAALKGAIESAQAQHRQECVPAVATGNQTCQLINRAVDGQNALVTALETYCNWNTNAPPPDTSAKCVPVASAQEGLQAAMNNANQLIQELKGVIH